MANWTRVYDLAFWDAVPHGGMGYPVLSWYCVNWVDRHRWAQKERIEYS